jgi:hypothetical protein
MTTDEYKLEDMIVDLIYYTLIIIIKTIEFIIYALISIVYLTIWFIICFIIAWILFDD